MTGLRNAAERLFPFFLPFHTATGIHPLVRILGSHRLVSRRRRWHCIRGTAVMARRMGSPNTISEGHNGGASHLNAN